MSQLFETATQPIMGYAQVAIEQGIDAAPEGLTYAIPDSMRDLRVGQRVFVPLGRKNKRVAGHVVEIAGPDAAPSLAPHQIKSILARDPEDISLPTDLIDLARWIAGYYCCPLGMVFNTMLPAAVKHGTGRVTQTLVSLAPTGDTEPPIKTTKLQRALLDLLKQRGHSQEPWVEVRELAALAGAKTTGPIKHLIDKGLLATRQDSTVRSHVQGLAGASQGPAAEIQLTEHQQTAIDRLAGHVHSGFSVHLLHGVTGSGKTEVYLRMIEHLLNGHGRDAQQGPPAGAIVLVPEIALTPQTITRFIQRFDTVAAMHSGLTAAQRHEQWRRVRTGQARIVVGARSAVFAPLPRVGVIIVDEEHDPSYKQDQLPRYHARDVAIKRAQLLGIPVVLGSATPSLESYFNATRSQETPAATAPGGKRSYHLLKLPARVAGLKLPRVETVDMKQERRERRPDGHVHLLSRRLELVLGQTIKSRSQAILLLNRRGYANYIACPDHRCGWLMNCHYCDAMMVYHKDQRLPTGGVLRCHHCRAEQLLPTHCPACSKKVTVFGIGTQRVEEEVASKFPGVRLARMDSDSMHTGRDYQETLEAFGRGELDVLVGTQMIAKGLDFPNVRLVGVVAADTALNIPDFRAAERTFQLIAQVAGRAGRGDPSLVGIVIVQAFNPSDPAIVLAGKHNYEGFARREIELRRESGLPPWSRMARIVVRDQDFQKCCDQAKSLADHLNRFNDDLKLGIELRGPVSAPLSRIAGFHRQQIELTAPEPAAASKLQKLLTAMRNAKLLHADSRTAVDVDPVVLL